MSEAIPDPAVDDLIEWMHNELPLIDEENPLLAFNARRQAKTFLDMHGGTVNRETADKLIDKAVQQSDSVEYSSDAVWDDKEAIVPK